MLSRDNQGYQCGPDGLQYARCNLLIPEMMIIILHGIAIHQNDCLVDVVRK